MELDHYNGVVSSLYSVHSVSMHLINLSDNKQKILYSTKMQSNLGDIYYYCCCWVQRLMNTQNIYTNPLTQKLNAWLDVQEIGI
jgi:hypothetical protein